VRDEHPSPESEEEVGVIRRDCKCGRDRGKRRRQMDGRQGNDQKPDDLLCRAASIVVVV
jgi:hypothetical protein